MNLQIAFYIIIGLVMLGLLVFALARRQGTRGGDPNYRALFVMGLIWLPAGIATDNPGLWGMGALFFIVGLANKSKWQRERKWSELSPKERKVKLAIVMGLSLLLVLGIAFYLMDGSSAVE